MLLTEFFFETKKITAKNDPCWSGYHMVGTKKNGAKPVPNCVPGKKEVSEFKDCVVPTRVNEEDHQWTNADNTYHTGNGQWSDQVGQWSGGATNTYHTGDGMWEDMATSNYITNEHVDFGDIITARELIGLALDDSKEHKHKYFEFLKHLRDTFSKEYSTQVHQHAAKLAKAAKE